MTCTHDDLAASIADLRVTVDRILVQTTITNGRVGRLDEEVFGHDGHHVPGLKADLDEIRSIVLDGRAVIRAVKWSLPILLPTSVATLVAVLV